MTVAIKSHALMQDGAAVSEVTSPYTGGQFATPPKIVVIHFTYGASAKSSAEWFQSVRNTDKASAHVVIERDGSLIQCVRFNLIAHHAGKSQWGSIVGLNRAAFGIELANWGYLERRAGGWTSYTGKSIENPILASHRNGNPDGSTKEIGWEPYPEVQFQTAVDVARALIDTYGVNEVVGHDDISKGRKWDPGPAFDMRRFRNLLFGDRASDGGTQQRVSVASGLNLRSGPGTQYPSIVLLPINTMVEPLEVDGAWLNVTVLGADGSPQRTGWVNANYLSTT